MGRAFDRVETFAVEIRTGDPVALVGQRLLGGIGERAVEGGGFGMGEYDMGVHDGVPLKPGLQSVVCVIVAK